MNKHVVRISRKWNNPAISIEVTDPSIAISMSLGDFLLAIAEEYGNPASTLTKAQHSARLTTAAAAVTESMKRETTAVV